ncbi:uncharacterized protein BCR38DRAFT_312389, partial [Pseudomassariella vexata]
ISGADNLEEHMLNPVKRKLSEEDQGRWLMIIDNVDDNSVLIDTTLNGRRLYDYLPRSRREMIIFTSRNRQIAVDLAP